MQNNIFSDEFKKILIDSNLAVKRNNGKIITPINILHTILHSNESAGYRLIYQCVNPNQLDIVTALDDFITIVDNAVISMASNISYNDTVSLDIDCDGQFNEILTISESTSNILQKCAKYATIYSINVYNSDFYILAMCDTMPTMFKSIGCDSIKFKQLISSSLVGGGRINPDGLDDIDDDFDDDRELNNSDPLERTNAPFLSKFSINLTQKAKDGLIEPVIGRQLEIDRMIQILNRKNKNNPIFIGEPGVGKTSIVEGFCNYAINSIDPNLKNLIIFQLSLANLVAGTKYRGEFEERLKKVIDELINCKNIILFIDELHTLIGSGSAEGSLDGANILKPYLARGDIKIIGATTIDEYRKHIEKDGALTRRFQSIVVKEPTIDQTIDILSGCKSNYEKFHNVKIDNDALISCVKLSDKFISDRFMPDKAFDILDESCSKVKSAWNNRGMDKLIEFESKLKDITNIKNKYIRENNIIAAKNAAIDESTLLVKINNFKNKIQSSTKSYPTVTVNDVSMVVNQITNIDVTQLTENEIDRLFNMENILNESIKGQPEAINIVSKAIRRWRSGINDPRRPICCIMELGPTGVGKTELAKTLAKYMFGDSNRLIKIDMSEYSDSVDVNKILGSTYGYVGYGQESKLVKEIRSHPHSVILFDEITRAHKDIYPLFLQLMDEGILTTGDGKTLNFKNSIIIFTSNLGADDISKIDKPSFGFSSNKNDMNKINEITHIINTRMENEFPPEFINRLDKTIIFNRLTKDLLYDIVKIKIDELSKRIDIPINISDNAIKYLIDANYDERYGARPIVRAIENNLEDDIADMILKSKVDYNHTINIDVDDKKYKFTVN